MTAEPVYAVRTIDASAARIFAVLADPYQHPALSGGGDVVEVVEADQVPLRLGAVFTMKMKNGLPYKTRNEVVACTENQTLAWKTTLLGGLVGGRVWRYDLEAVAEGTIVTETWDPTHDHQRFALGGTKMREDTQRQLTRSLERLEKVVRERGA